MQGTYLLLRRSKKYRNPVLFRLLTERNLCYLLWARCRPSRRIYTRTIHDTMSVCSANNCENTGTNDHNQIILLLVPHRAVSFYCWNSPVFFKAVSTPEHAIWDKVSKRYGNQSRIRSCFKFIPKQIETYVEADWSPRYAANSGLLTKIKGFKMQDRDSIWPEHTSLKW